MANSPFDTPIPRHAELQQILEGYGPLPEEIPCGLQNCRQSHGKGFIVSFIADGREAVGAIGHQCGRNHFGTSWVTQHKAYQTRLNDQKIEDRLRSFLPEADRVLAELSASSTRLHELLAIQSAIKTHAPTFFRACERAARSTDGWLGVDTPKGFDRQIKIEGAEFFPERTVKVSTEAQILRDDLERVRGHVANLKLDRDTLAGRVSDIGNAGQRWQSIADWMAAAERAIKPDNLGTLIAYLGDLVAGEIRISLNRKRILVMGIRPGEHRKDWIFADAPKAP